MNLREAKRKLKANPISLFFAIIGSSIIVFTILTLFNMIVKQLLIVPMNLVNAMTDFIVLNSIVLTLYSSFLATLITVIFGIPLAYVLARHDFFGKNIVESMVDVPVIIPHTVAGIALYALLMERSAIGTALSNLGLVFEDSLFGIVAAMFFVSAPFFINSAREGFQSIDPRIERVARTLGANQWQAFFKISLPLAIRQLFSGAVMSWARGISEFGAVIFIAFYPMIAPTLIYYRFTTQGLTGSQPIAVLLIIICFITFILLRLYSKKLGRYGNET